MLVALLCVATPAAHAHEVQPAVADLTLTRDRLELSIRLTVEAQVAGIDLQTVRDTNATAQADAYDRLRALPPPEMQQALRRFWPEFKGGITARAGNTDLDLSLDLARIPDVGNVELPRFTRLTLSAALPPGRDPVILGWQASFGPLVIRQQGEGDNLYTDYLTNGALTDPIPRPGGADGPAWQVLAEAVVIGFRQILPAGWEHVLLVLGMFLLVPRAGPILGQVAAFTLGHTVTLALAAFGLVPVPGPAIIIPMVAGTLVLVGLDNVMSRGPAPWRLPLVLGVGLVHGFGLAQALAEPGATLSASLPGLIGLSTGIALASLAVIGVASAVIGYGLGGQAWYRSRVTIPASFLIAGFGAWGVIAGALP